MGNNPHQPSRLRRQGREAYRAGLTLDDNPYLRSVAWGAKYYAPQWADGWHEEAKAEAAEKDSHKDSQSHEVVDYGAQLGALREDYFRLSVAVDRLTLELAEKSKQIEEKLDAQTSRPVARRRAR